MRNKLAWKISAVLLCMAVVLSSFAACSDKKNTPEVITDTDSSYSPEWVVEPSLSAQLIQPLVRPVYNENTKHYDVSYAECFVILVNGKYGLIGTDGNMIIDAEYDEIFAIRDGDDYLAIKDTEDGDEQTYIHSDTYRTQSARKKYNTKKYEYYWNEKNDSPLFICSKSGNIMEEEFDPVLPEAVKGVKKEGGSYTATGKYGLYVNGTNLTGMIYTNAGVYSDGLIAFESNGKWGYLDSEGRTAVPFEYDAVWGYNALGGKDTAYECFEGCITVSKDKKFGVIRSDGTVLIPMMFENATPVVDGKAFVKQNGKWGVIKVYNDGSASQNTTIPSTVPSDIDGDESLTSSTASSTTSSTSTSTSTTTTTTTTTTTVTQNSYSAGSYVITADTLNLREDPDAGSKWMATMSDGDVVYVDNVRNGWGHTTFRGKEGWFNLKYAEKY